jgi:transcriptional regulator with XRE-family HTH domain
MVTLNNMRRQPSKDGVMRRTWEIRSGADLGRAIADIRHIRGLTQAELAAHTSLSRNYLAQIEAGRSGTLIEKMLRALRRLGANVTITVELDRDADGQA